MAKESSAILKLVPLILLLVVIAAAGYIGYYIYLTSQSISHSASERINRKNVVFTKDGMKVGVKSYQNENYVDKTQGFVVKAWNLAKPGSTEGEKSGKKEQ